jgi:hypothetical protein
MRRPTLIALLFLSACDTQVSGRFVQTTPAPHPLAPKRAEQVQLYTSGHPDVPYTELGVIEEQIVWTGSGDPLELELAHMRQDGADRGCDAVVMGGSAEESRTGNHYGKGGFWGTCIVYNR